MPGSTPQVSAKLKSARPMVRLTLRIFLLLGVVPSIASSRSFAQEQRSAVRRAIDAINAQKHSIQSIFISYRAKVELTEAALKAGKGRGLHIDELITFAMKGKKRYLKCQSTFLDNVNKHQSKERLSIYDGAKCIIIDPKAARIQRDKSSYTELCTYMNEIGWAITEQDITAADRFKYEQGWLPQCLDHADWRADANKELVRDTECLVLINPTLGDKLFFDESKNFALVKRERQKSMEPDMTRQENDYFDLVQLTPSIWLPRKIRSKLTYKQDEVLELAWDVSEVEANQVKDQLFEVDHLRPGTLVFDTINKISFRYDEGNDVLETTVARTAFISRANSSIARGTLYAALWLFGVMLAGSSTLYWIKRRGEGMLRRHEAPKRAT